MLQSKLRQAQPVRWVAGVLQRAGDLVALGGGVIGLAVIVAVVLVGLHERQTSFRSMSPSESAQDQAPSYR